MIQTLSRLNKALLLLSLEVILLVPNCMVQSVDRQTKSIDEYWAESGLKEESLTSLLSEQDCYKDQKSFLSCVNSMSVVSEKYNLKLTESGALVKMTRDQIAKRLSEKQDMAQWEKVYQSQVRLSRSFINIWEELKANHIKPPEFQTSVAAGINGHYSISRDPHTYILPLSFYEEIVARSDSRMNNLGFIAKRQNQLAVVRKVFENSPAAKSGLRKGDRIKHINGIDVATLHPAQFADLLKLKTGDRLSLLIERNLGNKVQDKYIELIKSEYMAPSVSARMLPGDKYLGLITLHKFAKDTCLQTRHQLVTLKEQGVRGILLDLRDNPGGQVEEAACILGLFLDKGKPLFETRYVETLHPIDQYINENEPIYKGPLAVLINSGSASASEIVAGALKDYNRATLVGERTFGKGTFQDGRIWAPHMKIALFETEGMYYFPSGWTPQLVGIEPDIQVAFANTDSQREEELFYNPVRPKDMWAGPQSLTWLQQMKCSTDSVVWMDLAEVSGEDPQLQKAQAWMKCYD
ncbi:MAG: hypothetical protein BroJett040_18080 [Oligoflexia bacterium]|nr:MAG: hypothetical protein BroJett040_18080 [Oligoflexia bacterium]